jgi:uncharacterized damage-inducible protein DinB
MNWSELIHKEMTVAYASTDKMMGLLEDKDLEWKPATGENWMTAGQLLMHLTNACGMCFRGFVTGDWGLPEGTDEPKSNEESMFPKAEQLPTLTSVAEARVALEKDRELAIEMIEQAGEENLANLKTAAPWEPENERALGLHLLQMVDHLTIHKAQLFYYLKLMGQPVDTMTLWGV